MGGITSRTNRRTAYVSPVSPELAQQRIYESSLVLNLSLHCALSKQNIQQITPSDSIDSFIDELLGVSPNLRISRLDMVAMGNTYDIEGIKRNAIKLFEICAENGKITPFDSATIVFMCLTSHNFNGRIILNKVAIEMFDMTYELTSVSGINIHSISITELHVLLESICTMIEMFNNLWK